MENHKNLSDSTLKEIGLPILSKPSLILVLTGFITIYTVTVLTHTAPTIVTYLAVGFGNAMLQ